jgi:hypothetical protein
VDDILVVEIGYRTDKLGEHAADERWGEEIAVTSRYVKEIPAGVVAEHKDGACLLDAPGLQVHERWVP